MKKTVFVILLIFLAIIVAIFMNYRELTTNQNIATKFNKDFEFYNKASILGTDVTTVINRAINNNEKYSVPKDENDLYIANETDSIKIYVCFSTKDDEYYPMENLKKNGLKEFTRYFGEIEFRCTSIKYHQKTGTIAEMKFSVVD